MKNIFCKLGTLAFIGVVLLSPNISSAQTQSSVTTTTTTTSAGTVSAFSPDTIVVKTMTTADPVSYSYTKTTTYVDENGNAVSSETVKSGAPVTVYYEQKGDKMVATKVIVRKGAVTDANAPVTREITTTTASSTGTISQFNPDTMVVKTTSSADPVTYSSTKTTTYVDENGNTVSSETVKSGAPVTIYYTQDGDKMTATKVIVKKTTTTTTPAP
jgi:hypothetical protein